MIRWMAPEVILHQNFSEKSDIFSFGCILLEIVSKELPFSKINSTLEVANGISNGTSLPIEYENCAPWIKELMSQCTSFDASKRIDAGEITSICALNDPFKK